MSSFLTAHHHIIGHFSAIFSGPSCTSSSGSSVTSKLKTSALQRDVQKCAPFHQSLQELAETERSFNYFVLEGVKSCENYLNSIGSAQSLALMKQNS